MAGTLHIYLQTNVGADGDSHQRSAIFRRGLVDGHDAGSCGTDAGQQTLQRTGLVPQGGHHGDDLAAVLGVKNAVFVFIESTARQVYAAGRSRNAARLPAGQKLLGLDDLQEDFRQDLCIHQIKAAFQLVHLTNTSVLAENIITSDPLHCKRPDVFLSDCPVLMREVAHCLAGMAPIPWKKV